MVRIITLTAIIGVMLFLIPACADDDNAATPSSRPFGTLMGRVIDISISEPVSNVTVTITSKPSGIGDVNTDTVKVVTYTDQDGIFYHENIPSGYIEVKVQKEGYRTPPTQYWALSPKGKGEMLFELFPGNDPPSQFVNDEQVAWPPDYKDF